MSALARLGLSAYRCCPFGIFLSGSAGNRYDKYGVVPLCTAMKGYGNTSMTYDLICADVFLHCYMPNIIVLQVHVLRASSTFSTWRRQQISRDFITSAQNRDRQAIDRSRCVYVICQPFFFKFFNIDKTTNATNQERCQYLKIKHHVSHIVRTLLLLY